MQETLLQLVGIIAIGIAAQWVAWRVRVPAIPILLVAGFLVGSVTGLVDPDALLGDALFPLVSLAVAIILFEGGLSLELAELRGTGGAVRNLVTIGALVTWLGAAGAAYLFLDFDPALATLIGAILVVTGPTVIVPLLRQVRPSASVASVIKWEGIAIDPVGALLAVLVFDAIASTEAPTVGSAVLAMGEAVLVGTALGAAGAGAVIVVFRRHLVPDFLQSPVTLAVVVTIFAAANALAHETGLLAVTVMGAVLANQKRVSMYHILEFKENLRVLLISVLFVLLAARLPLDDPVYRSGGGLAFLAALVFVVRPVAVALSTFRSGLGWRERALLACIAPRGIVAAAVASVFTLELVELGFPGAERLAPAVFLVIVGTVVVYGLLAGPVARALGVATANPQGVLFVGASPLVREIARALRDRGVLVQFLDSNWQNVSAARQSGFAATYGNVLAAHVLDEMDLEQFGYLLAMTPNAEVNALAALHGSDLFDRANVYHLPPGTDTSTTKQADLPTHLRGRWLFEPGTSFNDLDARREAGATVKQTPLTDEFGYAEFTSLYGDGAVPLFTVSPNGRLQVVSADRPAAPRSGDVVISLAEEPREPAEPTTP